MGNRCEGKRVWKSISDFSCDIRMKTRCQIKGRCDYEDDYYQPLWWHVDYNLKRRSMKTLLLFCNSKENRKFRKHNSRKVVISYKTINKMRDPCFLAMSVESFQLYRNLSLILAKNKASAFIPVTEGGGIPNLSRRELLLTIFLKRLPKI